LANGCFLPLFHSFKSFIAGGFVNPIDAKPKGIASDFHLKFTPKLNLEGGNVYNLNLKLDLEVGNVCNLDPEGNVCDTFLGDFFVECT